MLCFRKNYFYDLEWPLYNEFYPLDCDAGSFGRWAQAKYVLTHLHNEKIQRNQVRRKVVTGPQ